MAWADFKTSPPFEMSGMTRLAGACPLDWNAKGLVGTFCGLGSCLQLGKSDRKTLLQLCADDST
jgi:hypothetical protein